MISVTIKTTTKRLIIHEGESTHKYHPKYPFEIHSTRERKLKQTTYKTLGKLEENLRETSGNFRLFRRLFHGGPCPPMTRLRAHALNKQGVSPLVRIPAVTKMETFLALQS